MSELAQFPAPTLPITADNPQVQAFAQMGEVAEAMLKAADEMAGWTMSFGTMARDFAATVQAARAVIEAADVPTRQ